MRGKFFAGAAFALTASSALAAPPVVTKAWSRPAAVGMMGGGFMTITADAADVLVGAESPLAKRVEIHRSMMKGGVMSMEPVARVPIPAKGSVVLAPGGLHLMLHGIRAPLKLGQTAPITLVFASGARVPARLTVSIQPPK